MNKKQNIIFLSLAILLLKPTIVYAGVSSNVAAIMIMSSAVVASNNNRVCSEDTLDYIKEQYYKVAKTCKLTAVGIRKGDLTFICMKPVDVKKEKLKTLEQQKRQIEEEINKIEEVKKE